MRPVCFFVSIYTGAVFNLFIIITEIPLLSDQIFLHYIKDHNSRYEA